MQADNRHFDIDAQKLADDALAACAALRKAGAHDADVLIVASESVDTSARMGRPEHIERAESLDMGLRAIIGKKQAFISASGVGDSARINELAERAVAMARAASDDPWCGLVDKSLLACDIPDLDLLDTYTPDTETLLAQAIATEEAALAIDGITNSEGANVQWGRSHFALATSDGFCGMYSGSSFGRSCAVIAGSGHRMERDYAAHRARFADMLETPETIGTRAAERTIARLDARKPVSTKLPIIFDKRVSASLLGHFAAAISGSAIARGTSFLKDKYEQAIMSACVTIIDDPRRTRGLASVAFDGEGVSSMPLTLLDKGVLRHWLLDSATARQLGFTSNGRAGRGIGSAPSPSTTNLYLEAGTVTRDELIADIDTGFLVTELIGMGVNMVTGDYSRGASGFWIEKGVIAYPVSEVTIAGNLRDMFAHLPPADDLEFRGSINAPSLRIDTMSLAGN